MAQRVEMLHFRKGTDTSCFKDNTEVKLPQFEVCWIKTSSRPVEEEDGGAGTSPTAWTVNLTVWGSQKSKEEQKIIQWHKLVLYISVLGGCFFFFFHHANLCTNSNRTYQGNHCLGKNPEFLVLGKIRNYLRDYRVREGIDKSMLFPLWKATF